MRSLLDPGARGEILERILRLTPDNDRLWGKMDCSQMLAHVGDQLRMALGDVPVNGARGVWRFALPRYLIIHVLPWPKVGAEAPAEAFTTVPTDWESDRATLLDLIERFAAIRPSELKPLHPLFGHLRPHDLGVLSYRHLDHHLRQFNG